jgi:hypothetical protein
MYFYENQLAVNLSIQTLAEEAYEAGFGAEPQVHDELADTNAIDPIQTPVNMQNHCDALMRKLLRG